MHAAASVEFSESRYRLSYASDIYAGTTIGSARALDASASSIITVAVTSIAYRQAYACTRTKPGGGANTGKTATSVDYTAA